MKIEITWHDDDKEKPLIDEIINQIEYVLNSSAEEWTSHNIGKNNVNGSMSKTIDISPANIIEKTKNYNKL
tara:strand:- start:5083 stop:5295 length:213 start_codon:yes stop_codon:yes gene_type:complete